MTADDRVDVAIVGGGYAGLWTAWELAERDPGLRIAVLEAETCGSGPSGRNAGFVNGFWHRADLLTAHFGDDAAREACVAAAASVEAIGAWARAREVDIGWRRGGHLKVATSAAQEGATDAAVAACARLGRGDEYVPVDASEARRRCDSPLFRGGAWMPDAATVQPARLALALRAAVLERGVHDLRAHPRALDRARGGRRRPDRDRDRGPATSGLGGAGRQCGHRRDPPPALAAGGELDPHDPHRAGPRRAR